MAQANLAGTKLSPFAWKSLLGQRRQFPRDRQRTILVKVIPVGGPQEGPARARKNRPWPGLGWPSPRDPVT
ncbi:MAG: hypothetical protein LBR11_07135 [Deltaproteobacteria bacterium]|nr:hypothetical protein [Deltaproteobacteria bacterium]